MPTNTEIAREIVMIASDGKEDEKMAEGLARANKDALEWMMTKIKASRTQQNKQTNKQINKQTKMK